MQTANRFFCPRCNAEIILKEAESFLNCAGCGTSIYVDLTKVVLTLYHNPLVPKEKVGRIVVDYLNKKGIKEEVSIKSVELSFYPFWKNNNFTPAVHHPHYLNQVSELKGEPKPLLEKNNWTFISPETFSNEEETLLYHPFYTVKGIYKENNFEFFIDSVEEKIVFENLLRLFPISSSGKFSFFMIGLTLLFFLEGLLIGSNLLTIAAYAFTSYLFFPYIKNLIYEE